MSDEDGIHTAVELAPPATETPLLRVEFAAEMKSQKGMNVATLVQKAIAGIEAGKVEIRPGLSNVLKLMSRLAPNFMPNQMSTNDAGEALRGTNAKGVQDVAESAYRFFGHPQSHSSCDAGFTRYR
jgi:hypothetical protein